MPAEGPVGQGIATSTVPFLKFENRNSRPNI